MERSMCTAPHQRPLRPLETPDFNFFAVQNIWKLRERKRNADKTLISEKQSGLDPHFLSNKNYSVQNPERI
jgi:hypothetical protein